MTGAERKTLEDFLALGGIAVALLGFLMWWSAQWMQMHDQRKERDERIERLLKR